MHTGGTSRSRCTLSALSVVLLLLMACAGVEFRNEPGDLGFYFTGERIPGRPEARYAFEGSTIVLRWAPVAGASYYNVYYDDYHSSSGCRVSSRGSASGCEELATYITDTSYTHSDRDDNSYWVVACNRVGCSRIDGLNSNPATIVGTAPDAPAARYVFEGSTIVLRWDPVAGASYYNVYHDDYHSSGCRVSYRGSASFCEELATNINGTSYTHSDPDSYANYYWVVACNSSGCSQVDDNRATTVGTGPGAPAARYAFEGSTIVLRWDSVAGASFYNVYYDDYHSSGCQVRSGGRVAFCEELATNITGTSYTHSDRAPYDNYYWVVACDRSGCSQVDSDNPATTVGTAPGAPAARYAFEGSTIVLRWDPVAGASFYNVYYDDFFSSYGCQVSSRGTAFCEELATNITGTSYTHSDPDDDANDYWVVACNRSGCSPVDSNNPATPSTP